jgi:hypothetical protein
MSPTHPRATIDIDHLLDASMALLKNHLINGWLPAYALAALIPELSASASTLPVSTDHQTNE